MKVSLEVTMSAEAFAQITSLMEIGHSFESILNKGLLTLDDKYTSEGEKFIEMLNQPHTRISREFYRKGNQYIHSMCKNIAVLYYCNPSQLELIENNCTGRTSDDENDSVKG